MTYEPGTYGTRIRGNIDLLIDMLGGWALVDHKSTHAEGTGIDVLSARLAETYAQQLALYADALQASTARRANQSWQYLPLLASMVRMDGLKSEVQHPASGKVHRCKPVRHTDSFSLRSA